MKALSGVNGLAAFLVAALGFAQHFCLIIRGLEYPY